MKKLFLLVVLMIALASPAFAEKWLEIGSDEAGKTTVYLDKDSADPEGVARFVKVQLKSVTNSNSSVMYITFELDCGAYALYRQYRPLYYTVLGKPMGPLEVWNLFLVKGKDAEWKVIEPGTNMETVADEICRYQMIPQ